jgi:hypothetical protein
VSSDLDLERFRGGLEGEVRFLKFEELGLDVLWDVPTGQRDAKIPEVTFREVQRIGRNKERGKREVIRSALLHKAEGRCRGSSNGRTQKLVPARAWLLELRCLELEGRPSPARACQADPSEKKTDQVEVSSRKGRKSIDEFKAKERTN